MYLFYVGTTAMATNNKKSKAICGGVFYTYLNNVTWYMYDVHLRVLRDLIIFGRYNTV